MQIFLKPETLPPAGQARNLSPGTRDLTPPSATPDTTHTPATDTGILEQLDDLYQVILHNDDHNAMERVVHCLMQVFGHSQDLAIKIMLEAHDRGSAIAEVEAESQAQLHRDQLQSFGLSATVEKV